MTDLAPWGAALSPGFDFGGASAFALLFVGVVLFVGIAALTRQNDRPYSATVFYLALGVLASVGLGLLGVRRLNPITDHSVFKDITEVALVIAVFGAGLSIERRVRRSSIRLIGLLLAVVMPLTVAAVAVYGRLVMGLPLGAAILLGAVLAPTDPVLAGDVGLGGPGSAPSGEPRLSLHIEAGANDGLASPLVVVGLLVASHGGTGWIGHWVAVDLLYRVGVAVLLGAAAGWTAAAAIGGAGSVGPSGATMSEDASKRLAALEQLRAKGRPFVLHLYASYWGPALRRPPSSRATRSRSIPRPVSR